MGGPRSDAIVGPFPRDIFRECKIPVSYDDVGGSVTVRRSGGGVLEGGVKAVASRNGGCRCLDSLVFVTELRELCDARKLRTLYVGADGEGGRRSDIPR